MAPSRSSWERLGRTLSPPSVSSWRLSGLGTDCRDFQVTLTSGLTASSSVTELTARVSRHLRQNSGGAR